MRIFIRLLVLLLLSCVMSQSQTLPETPQPETKMWFAVSESIQYSGVFLDGVMSTYGTENHCGYEGNPRFALDGGRRFNAKKYYAVNIPIATGLTAMHVVVYKRTQNRWARRIADILVASNGIPHLYQGARWIAFCDTKRVE